jgi:hypothetical protein
MDKGPREPLRLQGGITAAFFLLGARQPSTFRSPPGRAPLNAFCPKAWARRRCRMKLLLGGSGCHERLPCRQVSLTAPQGVEDDGLPDRQINRRGDRRSGAGEANFWHRFFPKNTKGIRGLVMRIIFALIALVASVVLGGCFYHHYQTATVEPLPPPPSYPPPIK